MLRHRSVVMGGLRALLMQAVHPAIATAIESSGTYHRDPWGRHARTVRLILLILLGAEDEALAAVRRVNRMHHRAVTLGRGQPGEQASPATDPDLLLWVYAGLVSSFLVFEELTVGLLDDPARERACQELAGVGVLLGIPRSRVPFSMGELDQYLTTVVRSGVLRPTDSSRKLLDILTRRAPLVTRAILRPAVVVSLGTLPPEIRSLYGPSGQALSGSRRVTAVSRAFRWANHLLPGRLRCVDPTPAKHPAGMSQADLLSGPEGGESGRP
jgi:uncharacterized protein (DUF2236 family)